MFRHRRYQNRGGLKFAKSDIYGQIVDAGGGGYDIGNYDYTKKSDHSIHDGGYGHSGSGGGYGHSGVGYGLSGDGYGHGGGGYGHSDDGYGHHSYSYDGGGYGHSGGGYGHESYGGYGGHASYGGYGKMDCPGVPIALLLTTLLGIGGRTLLQLIAITTSELNIKLLNLIWLLEV